MGKNNFTGYIDGDQVPRIFRKNIVGDVAGISTDGLGTWPGSGTIEFTEGEYLNQIAWDMDSLSFFKWDGEDWTRCKGDEALELFRNRNEYQGNAEKESMKFESYSTAIQPKGSTSVRYPSDVSTGKNSDFVLFDFFDYQPPFRDNQAFSSELPSKVRASQGVQKLGFGDSGKRLFTNETLNQYNRTGTSAELYKRDQTGQFPQLMLYMPDDISDTLKADWEGKAFGSTTAGILSAAGADNFANKIKEATNTIGKNNDKRWRIEHAQMVSDKDLIKFKKYNIVPSMQPSHCTSDMHWLPERIGNHRLKLISRWQSFINMGVKIPGGSDCPIEAGNPLFEFYAAVTRQDHTSFPKMGFQPQEKVISDDALKMFTKWGAYGSFNEHHQGQISPGFNGDLTIISDDILSVNHKNILDIEILYTIVNGKIVYKK